MDKWNFPNIIYDLTTKRNLLKSKTVWPSFNIKSMFVDDSIDKKLAKFNLGSPPFFSLFCSFF